MAKPDSILLKSSVLPPVILAIAVVAILAILFPSEFSGRKINLVTSEVMGFGKEIRYADLNNDGNSERIEFNYDESHQPFMIIIGNNKIINQFVFPGLWFPSDGFLVGDTDRDSLSEIFTFIYRKDSLFCAFVEPFNTEPLVEVRFLKRLDPDFRKTDIHVEALGPVPAGKGDEVVINLGSRWITGDCAFIRFNPLSTMPVTFIPPVPIENARLTRRQDTGDFLITGDIRPDVHGITRLAAYSVRFEPLFEPVVLEPGFQNCRVTPIRSVNGLDLAVIQDDPDRGGEAVLTTFDSGGNLKIRRLIAEPATYDPLPYHRNMDYRSSSLNREEENSSHGFSVRCVKDTPGDAVKNLVDPRDGNEYRTFSGGNRTWMAENLNYKGIEPAWPADQDSLPNPSYGMLYSWESAKKACPPGWHLSTDGEWQRLEIEAGMSKFAYDMGWRWFHSVDRKFQSEKGWYADSLSNETGFNALPAGHWSIPDDKSRNEGRHSYFWTSTRSGEWTVLDPDPGNGEFYLIHSQGVVLRVKPDGSISENSFRLPVMKIAEYLSGDLDGNRTKELIFLGERGNTLLIRDQSLRNQGALPIVYSYGESRLSPEFKNNRISRWYYQNGDKGWFFNYVHGDWMRSMLRIMGLFILLAGLFALILFWQRKQIIKRNNLEKEMLSLMYQGLANQFNPHLTFNLFNAVSCFLQTDQQEQAMKLTFRYAQLLRRSMMNGRTFEISLSEELDAAADLLEIEVMSTEGQFSYEIITEPGLDEVRLPRSLIFQFVENAIKHGARAQPDHPMIRVSTRLENSILVVEVSDNGPGLHNNAGTPVNGTGSGFRIADELLSLYRRHSGRQITYEFIPAPDSSSTTFTRVQILIPVPSGTLP